MAQMIGLGRTLYETAAGTTVGRTLPGVCRRCNRAHLVQVHTRRFSVGVPAVLVIAAAALVVVTWDTRGMAAGAVDALAVLKVLLTAAAWLTLFARRVRPRCPICDLGRFDAVQPAETVDEPAAPSVARWAAAPRPTALSTKPRPVPVPPKTPQADLDLDLSFLDQELDRSDPPTR